MVFVSLANKVFQKLETIPMYNYPNFLNLLTTFACECVCLLTREYPKTHIGTWYSKATYIVYATTFNLCTHADQDLVRCTNAGCTVADSYRVHIYQLAYFPRNLFGYGRARYESGSGEHESNVHVHVNFRECSHDDMFATERCIS